MQDRVLLFGYNPAKKNAYGGGVATASLLTMLQNVYGEDKIDTIEISTPSNFQRVRSMLTLQSYGHSKEVFRALKDSVYSNTYKFIIFNFSLYGKYVKYCKKHNVETILYCHNIENAFYFQKYKASKNFLDYLMFKYVAYNERLCMKYADRVIILNQRDNMNLKELYHREADLILPLCLDSNNSYIGNRYAIKEPYVLFVGSNFFANSEGIKWYIENVSNKIKYKTYIVGSICDSIMQWIDLSKYPKVRLIGFVDDIDIYYANAVAVICPIFSGSGMKIKTIEALKYKKTIIGTSEAFEGIDLANHKIGSICNTISEFVSGINLLDETSMINMESYNLFMEKYSIENVSKKLDFFLQPK